MDKFRTEVTIFSSPHKISYRSSILFIGSCFTENIGVKMQEYKFNVDINPFGIVYNPLSVKQNLDALLECKQYAKSDLFHYTDRWISFDHHSRFSDKDAESCLERINQRIDYAAKKLKETDFLIVTFGTAWIYKLADSGKLVSNCHKLPSKFFQRELIKIEDIVQNYMLLIKSLLKINPQIKIILTVSPVRHWKDGPVQNTLSKSILLLAIHELVSAYDCTEYFPAYEIAIDDLRDYRFYEADMLHPNSQMTSYIWNKFCQAYFDDETVKLMKELEKLIHAMQHKPFFPGSVQHRDFLVKQVEYVTFLQEKYPFLNLSEDKIHLEKQLSKL